MKLLIALALGAAAHAADDLKEVNGHGRRLEALDGQIYSLETTFDVAGGRKLVEDAGRRGGVAVQVASGRGAASCAAGAHDLVSTLSPLPRARCRVFPPPPF